MSRPRYIPRHLATGSEEASWVERVFRSVGGIVYTTSDPRVRRATRGILDHIILLPAPATLLFWDSKAGTGRLSPEQREFIERVVGRTTEAGYGDADAAREYLRQRALRK